MRRSELRKKIYMLLFAGILLLSMPVALIRISLAATHITGREIMQYSDTYGTVQARDGSVFFDGTIHGDEVLGNLIGSTGMNYNTLVDGYGKELAPKAPNCFGGLKALKKKQGNIMHTTLLSLEAHAKLADLMEGYDGCAFAYNYKTGEILFCLSLPSTAYRSEVDGSLLNKCLNGQYAPGSTMKIVTALCALEQNPELQNMEFECVGEMPLDDGSQVTCQGHTAHGLLDLVSATGYSCNCYYATLVQQLKLSDTQKILDRMGFVVNDRGECYADMGDMYWNYSSISVNSVHGGNDVWSFIGQASTMVSPIHMAILAGSIASSDGTAAMPYMVESFENPHNGKVRPYSDTEIRQWIPSEISTQMASVWTAATDLNYREEPRYLRPEITAAKTGTAEQGDGSTNRALMGYMQDYDTAFYIMVEDLPPHDTLPLQIANAMVDYLPSPEE